MASPPSLNQRTAVFATTEKKTRADRQSSWLRDVLPGRSRRASISSQNTPLTTSGDPAGSADPNQQRLQRPEPPVRVEITRPPPAAHRSPRTTIFPGGTSPASPTTLTADGQQRSIDGKASVPPQHRNDRLPSAFGGHGRNSSMGSAAEGSWRDRSTDHRPPPLQGGSDPEDPKHERGDPKSSSRWRRQQTGGQRHSFSLNPNPRRSSVSLAKSEAPPIENLHPLPEPPATHPAGDVHQAVNRFSAPRLALEFTTHSDLSRAMERFHLSDTPPPPPPRIPSALPSEDPIQEISLSQDDGGPSSPASASLSPPLVIRLPYSAASSDTASQSTMDELSRCSTGGPPPTSANATNAGSNPEAGGAPSNRKRRRGRRQAGGQRHPIVTGHPPAQGLASSPTSAARPLGVIVEAIVEDPREWRPGGGRHPVRNRQPPRHVVEASASNPSIPSSGSDELANPKLWVPGGGRHPAHLPSPEEVARRIPQVPQQRTESSEGGHRAGQTYSAILKTHTRRPRNLLALRSPKRANLESEAIHTPTASASANETSSLQQSTPDTPTQQTSGPSCPPQTLISPQAANHDASLPQTSESRLAGSSKKEKSSKLKAPAPLILPWTDRTRLQQGTPGDGKTAVRPQSWLGEWQAFEIQNIVPSSPTSSSVSSHNNAPSMHTGHDSDLEETT